MNTISVLNEKIKNATDLDFGNIFNDAIELFKKTWLQGFLLQLFGVLIMLPIIIVAYAPLVAMIIAQEQSGAYDPDLAGAFFAGFSIFYILLFILAIVVLGGIVLALNAGFYRIMKKMDHGEATSTNDFFYFVKGKYLGKTIGITLTSVIISILGALLCYIPIIYLIVPLSLFAPIFAFNPHMGIGDIVKISFTLGTKKWLILFGLIIISSILAQFVGILACGIGVLFTAAFVYHPVYIVYKKVIGFEDDNEIAEIGMIEE